MAHLCKVCTGYSPYWDLHDVNPPCEGHENWLLLKSFYDVETYSFIIPVATSDETRRKIARALADKANFHRGLT
jgi:hypothetical protein